MSELEQRQAVVAEATSWLATPYHQLADVKGVGVDCSMILMRVCSQVGLVEFVDPRPYEPNWHLHRSEELYVGWLERMGAHRVQAPALGDVVLFKFGRCFSHGGFFVDVPEEGGEEGAQVLHAYLGRGVILSRLREEPLHGRVREYWSLWPPAAAGPEPTP